MDRMIRRCADRDFQAVHRVINAGAEVYRGVIPADRWKEPYMPEAELESDIALGIAFWGYEEGAKLIAVMGIQDVSDVTLIRHAYTLPAHQRRGIGSRLLEFLCSQTKKPVLIGTWAAATWAIDFYRKHGFAQASRKNGDILLRKYWRIPERQITTSVVLSNVPVERLIL